MDNIYPEWKKVAWRFLRVFISAFLFTGSMVLINAQPEMLGSWNKFLNTLVLPFRSIRDQTTDSHIHLCRFPLKPTPGVD